MKICSVNTIQRLCKFGDLLRQYLPKIITFTIWISLILIFLIYKISNNLTLEQIFLNLYNYLHLSKTGVFIYLVLFAIRPFLLFPASIMNILAGALYGPWYGMIYAIIGENSSGNVAYLTGRMLTSKHIKEKKEGKIKKLRDILNKKPFMSIMMLRLLLFPYDPLSYGAGFLKINWKGYMLGTLIGAFPSLVMFVLAGSAFYVQKQKITSIYQISSDVDISIILLSGIGMIIIVLLANLIKKHTMILKKTSK